MRIAYDIPAAAAECSVTDKRIRQAIHSGALRAKKDGRRYLIGADALRAWFDGLEDA